MILQTKTEMICTSEISQASCRCTMLRRVTHWGEETLSSADSLTLGFTLTHVSDEDVK